ncbi:MAG: HAMP domain-containing sensor histidine kinase [Candidatus Calescibacterium sp.]|nr:HAMP domain-containing histidine kinase [Candidatus Calescibacterium sp.]MCX7971996.1 HAMP domain-containing histidine kinase [bacterium]MDW8195484.1 HAMP domain-containing sensor histidine kinase [Candidatus Calescibacterium sp.]
MAEQLDLKSIFDCQDYIQARLEKQEVIGLITLDLSSSGMIKEKHGLEFYKNIFSTISSFLVSFKGKIFRQDDLVLTNDYRDDQLIILLISKPRYKKVLDIYSLKIAAIRIISELKSNIIKYNTEFEKIRNIIDNISYGYALVKYDKNKNIRSIIFDAFSEAYLRQKFDEISEKIISMVSHELRTPLTSIRGFAETILQEDLSKEEIMKFVQIIYNESNRLNNLVNAILDISRIEAAKVHFKRKKFDIKDVIENVLELFYLRIKSSDLTIIREYSDEESYIVFADEEKVEQILVNLIDNAIKYTPFGGEIRVGIKKQDSEVLVSISDTGIGIPDKDKPHIFEKFFRTSVSMSVAQGSGLGLVIVKYLVETLGGRIWFESQLSVGTTFYFTLPVDETR